MYVSLPLHNPSSYPLHKIFQTDNDRRKAHMPSLYPLRSYCPLLRKLLLCAPVACIPSRIPHEVVMMYWNMHAQCYATHTDVAQQ